jgi:hypothetical protein
MTLFEILTDEESGLGLPCAYSHFRDDEVPESPPYLVYIGSGQSNFEADNSYYWGRNRYQIEYYFTSKDETQEAAIEKLLLDNGYLYEKSEDVYIEDQGVFVIYYNV